MPRADVCILIYAIAAGFTYCGVCTLSLLEKLPAIDDRKSTPGTAATSERDFIQDILHWLVYRQNTTLVEEEQPREIPVQSVNGQLENSGAHTEASENEHHANGPFPLNHHAEPPPGAFVIQGASTDVNPLLPSPGTQNSDTLDLHWVGFNGRTNKVADTCYAFWVGGTLGVSIHFMALVPVSNVKVD